MHPIGYGRKPRGSASKVKVRKNKSKVQKNKSPWMRRKRPKKGKRRTTVIKPCQTDTLIRDVFFSLCKNANSATSLGLWLCFKYQDFRSLVEHSLDPISYHDRSFRSGLRGPDVFQMDYLCVEFLSKYKGFDLGWSTKERALDSFAAAERKCLATNRVFKDPMLRGITSRVHSVLHGAARKIAGILGSVSSVKLTDCGWGPGCTFSLGSRRSTLVHKLREERISVTPLALPLAMQVIGQDIHWLRARDIPADAPCTLLAYEFNLVDGNRITTVPKNAKTDRVIAEEPTANIFLQKAFGSYIRHRLRKHGIDLNDQGINQSLAARALDLGLATVDLKSASDTISRAVVEHLLPPDWVTALDAVRSPRYLDGTQEWKTYYKWSSMGNGYTFELESLIFFALACACHDLSCDSECILPSVYGDDVIIHKDALPLFIETLGLCGFEVNTKKTHANSGFRESCGEHYFCGERVTPFYQKEIPNVLEEVYRLANRIRRAAARSYTDRFRRSGLRNAWLRILRSVPHMSHILPLGREGDTGLVFSVQDYIEHGIPIPLDNGDFIKTYAFKPRKMSVRHDPLYAYWLRFTPPTPFEGKVDVRRMGNYGPAKERNYQAPLDAPW